MFNAPSIGRPKVLITTPPFSFFQFAEKYQNSLPLKRIFSIMRKQNVASLVEETIHPNDEFSQEIQALEKKLSSKLTNNNIIRLTFFNIDINKLGIENVHNRHCLGSVIFRISRFANGQKVKNVYNVYEAVIRQRRLINNYVHCFAKYQIKCLNKNFNIKASYFCQQNSITNVCAQASLKMVSHCLKKLNVKPFNYEEINKIITNKFKNFKPEEGLEVAQIAKILETTDLEIKGHSYDKERVPPYEFQQLIYSTVESGFPALLAFKTLGGDGHIVPVIGHTFNDDNWLPNAEKDYFQLGKVKYLRSTDWVNNFIIHDDNYGTYFCLPVKFFKNDQLIAVFQIFPKGVEEAPINIELRAVLSLEEITRRIYRNSQLKKFTNNNYWFNKLKEVILDNKIVIRTFLIKRNEYIKSLRNKDIDGLSIEENYIKYLKGNLPTLFWISEISLPELFPTNKRKIADIIIDSSKELHDRNILDPLLLFKLPGLLIFEVQGETRAFHTKSKSHIPLITRRSITK